jgi:nitric oxide synthase oxygenase domain/subunit
VCKQLSWPLTYQCKQLGWSTARISFEQLGSIKSKVCNQLGWPLTYQCKQLGWSTARISFEQLGCIKIALEAGSQTGRREQAQAHNKLYSYKKG